MKRELRGRREAISAFENANQPTRLKSLRRALGKLAGDNPSFDGLLCGFLREFHAAAGMPLRILVAEESGHWLYRWSSWNGGGAPVLGRSSPVKHWVSPPYDGFRKHLKPIQDAAHLSERHYRIVESLPQLFSDEESTSMMDALGKGTFKSRFFGLPCGRTSTNGRRVWLLLHCCDEGEESPLLEELGEIGERLGLYLFQADYRRLNEQREMVEAREEAVAVLAHELKSPLAGIQHGLDLAGRELDGQDPLRAHTLLNTCRARIDGAGRLIAAYLDYVKLRRFPLGPVTLAEILAETASFFRFRLEELQIDFQITWTSDRDGAGREAEFILLGHKLLAFQVLQNLIENAVKAILQKRDSGLSLSTGDAIAVRARKSGSRIFVEVEDTGSGVASHLLPTLFTPFVSGFREGHGLGLSTCRKIMESHGGAIEYKVANKPGPMESSEKTERHFFLLTFLSPEAQSLLTPRIPQD